MSEPPLVLAAHGSSDPRFAEVIDGLVDLIVTTRPRLDVRVGYLDHGVPIESVATADSVVVPVLLASGFHIHSDIPARAAGTITRPVGPERRLVTVLAARLDEAGWDGQQPLILAATGSANPKAVADVHQTARDLGDELGLDVSAAFISEGEPRLREVYAAAVASYLLAPGRLFDVVAGIGASVVAAPLGAHPLVAAIILDRYDDARATAELA